MQSNKVIEKKQRAKKKIIWYSNDTDQQENKDKKIPKVIPKVQKIFSADNEEALESTTLKSSDSDSSSEDVNLRRRRSDSPVRRLINDSDKSNLGSQHSSQCQNSESKSSKLLSNIEGICSRTNSLQIRFSKSMDSLKYLPNRVRAMKSENHNQFMQNNRILKKLEKDLRDLSSRVKRIEKKVSMSHSVLEQREIVKKREKKWAGRRKEWGDQECQWGDMTQKEVGRDGGLVDTDAIKAGNTQISVAKRTRGRKKGKKVTKSPKKEQKPKENSNKRIPSPPKKSGRKNHKRKAPKSKRQKTRESQTSYVPRTNLKKSPNKVCKKRSKIN
ncbi:unnamed protein product [Moneuplotes crassus]|uniref:Uncharacterized protein n=1 Tax=Euplotes crassus TaxID=5936 RepID=A0AAD1UFG9_EUPCR|nr:unnamed protein product [Moneuplotes crassus]